MIVNTKGWSCCWGAVIMSTVGHSDGSAAKLTGPALRFDPSRLSSGLYAALFAGTERLTEPEVALWQGASLAAPVALDPKVGPNLRLGDDPSALPSAFRAQAEPHLARSVTDTNLLVATFQEGRYTDGGAVNCGYAISEDGGTTWSRGLIPHLVGGSDGGPFARVSDPVAGVNLDNTILLNTLGITGSPNAFRTTILLSTSTDGGRTFSRPLTVLTNSLPDVMLDKNWMTVNTFPQTPGAGRICVTFTRFDTTSGSQVNPIFELHSDDGGTNWTSPVQISPAICQGSQPVFLPDGTLAVVYWNFAGPNGQRIEVAVSPDGGDAPFVRRVVTDVPAPYDDVQARDGLFLPSATGDRTLGLLYVVYQARVNGVPRILFTRSSDQGVNWTKPIPTTDTPGGAGVFNPAIAASPDGQHVTVAYFDKRHDTTGGFLYDLYLTESFDGGDTWQPTLRLSDRSSDLRLAPRTSTGYMVGDYHGIVPALNLAAPAWAIWVDTRTGSPDPFVVSIMRTQGSRFETWRQLAFTPTQLNDPAVSGAEADADRDQVPNAFEYALARDPRRADGPDFAARKRGTPGADVLSAYYAVSAVATDATVGWIRSPDLKSWSPASPGVGELRDNDPSLNALRATFLPTAPREFQRLSVTLTP